jgi:hypothetical protein
MESGKNYRLRVPKDARARQFWSLTMYDNATWNFIMNPLKRNGLSSLQRDSMKMNARSVDFYFGPKAPTGFENDGEETISLVSALCPGRSILEQDI